MPDPVEGKPDASKDDKSKDVITMTSAQLAERLARAKPDDYDDLKAKAEKLNEIEQANKTEVQKAQDDAAKAKADADKARAEALRWKVAAKHGITDEDADLFLTGTDESTLTKQAERLAERGSKPKNVVPREGTTPPPAGADPMREFARGLFGRDD